MREASHAFTFAHTPFSETAITFWSRYRSPLAAHVVSEDTLARSFDGTCLHTVRLVKKERRSLPKWLPARLAAIRDTWILERTILDAEGQLLLTVSRNMTHRAVADGVEWQTLEGQPTDDTLSTSVFSIVSQTAAKSMAGPFIQDQIEHAFIAANKGAAERSRQGFEFILGVLADQRLRHTFLFGQDEPRFARGSTLAPLMKHAEAELAGFSGHGLENAQDRYSVVQIKPMQQRNNYWSLAWRWREENETPGGVLPRATPIRDWVYSKYRRLFNRSNETRDDSDD